MAVRGRHPLAHLLLAVASLLKGRSKFRALRWAAQLAPTSYDATRALASFMRSHGNSQSATALAPTGLVAESLLAELQDGEDLRSSEAGRLLEFYVTMRRTQGLQTHAQLMQDVWVLFQFRGKRDGYFVEFGALDGVVLSNTLLLERDFGWKGILVEPNPRYHADLRRQRRAIVDTRCVWSESNRTLRLVDCGELSTIEEYRDRDDHRRCRARSNRVLEVSTVSLNDLLEEHGAPEEIDFLSVDTEGSEYDVLKMFDFERHRPKVICVEHNFTLAERRLDNLLGQRGYQRHLPRLSRFDGWYVHAADTVDALARVAGSSSRGT